MDPEQQQTLARILHDMTAETYQAVLLRVLNSGQLPVTTPTHQGHAIEDLHVSEDVQNAIEPAVKPGRYLTRSHASSIGTEGAPHNPHMSPPMLESDSGGSDPVSPMSSPPTNCIAPVLRSTPYPSTSTYAPRLQSGNAASQLKRSFSEANGRTVTGKRLTGEHDPENREILRLRQEEHLGFDDIARILNAKRIKTGMTPDLTLNAIYSRYKRNGPLIAASEGKEFVPSPIDRRSNGKGINFSKVKPIVGFDDQEDELLVRAVADVEAKKWDLVAARVEEIGGRKHEPDMCAARFQRL